MYGIKLTHIITVICILALVSLTRLAFDVYSYKKASAKKTPIKLEEVENIGIQNDTYRLLTNEQVSLFVDKWNNSKPRGMVKSAVKYVIFIIFKDGTVRKFRANSNTIKEDGDWGFDIGEEQFFDNLFTDAMIGNSQ